jgi:nucleotide-binding universal stress UspA family protein
LFVQAAGAARNKTMKVLVAVDGSKFTKRMLAYLAAHDEWLGAKQQYTVLTVVGAVPSRAAAALSKKVVQDHYAEEAERVLKPIRSFFDKQGIGAEFVHRVGEPAEQIADCASKGRFELLMMGSHGHGALARLVLGSVTNRVLASCEVPLLIVR